MFSKKCDNWFKVTNCILIIMFIISLGYGIGNTIYIESEDYYHYCGDYRNSYEKEYGSVQSNHEDVEAENNEVLNCVYLNQVNAQQCEKEKILGYTFSVISILGLILVNAFTKRD